ncbi:MSP domain protein, partial [Cooperia oncophora]
TPLQKRGSAGKSQKSGRSKSGKSERSKSSKSKRKGKSSRSSRSKSRRGKGSKSSRSKSRSRSKSKRGKSSSKSGRSRKSRRSKSKKSRRSKSKRSKKGKRSKSSRSSRSKSRRSKSKRGSSSRRSKSSRSARASGASLPAKPSELRVEPCELSYKAIGGLKGVNVVNDTQERKFFKVKCSDNMLYRVNPVFGVVEPGKSSRIDILRQNGGAKIDKIVLVTTKAEDGETPSRDVFNQGRNTEMMVLPLLVQE